MEKIAYFDYAAIVIFGVLIISFITRKMLKGRLNRDFLALVVVAFFTTIFDAYAVAFDRRPWLAVDGMLIGPCRSRNMTCQAG